MAQLSTNPLLSNFSWQDLQATYAHLGKQMGQYEGVHKRIGVPATMDINLSDADNIFISRFWRDVTRIEKQFKLLDAEIARRNNLIGVMG